MHVFIMPSAHGFGIQEVQDSNSEGMELHFNCPVKYIQVSSCVLREMVPPLSYHNSRDDECLMRKTGHFSPLNLSILG